MLAANLERILAALPDDARVLDVGGWAGPLNRADYILDYMPYESRGALMPDGFGPGPERFSEETWIRRDICDHDPYPFPDDYFDYVVCVFTLEDLRDPIWVCREMSRIGRAGYIEVPSLIDELSWGVPEASGGPWCGHMHHRWLCTEEDGELVFMEKYHSIHSNSRVTVPSSWAAHLTPEERTLAHFWDGEVHARERLIIDTKPSYPLAELERHILEHFEATASEHRKAVWRDRGRTIAQAARGRLRELGARASRGGGSTRASPRAGRP